MIMKRIVYSIGLACLMSLCALSGANAQRSEGRSVESSRSTSTTQRQEARQSTSRSSATSRSSSSAAVSNQRSTGVSDRSSSSATTRSSSSTAVSNQRSTAVSDRSNSSRNNVEHSSSVSQDRGATSARNSNATVVERNRNTTTRPTDLRGSNDGNRNLNTPAPKPREEVRPHAQYDRHTPPPRGYQRNSHPPKGYHFIAPPHGHGCPRDYRFNTPPPHRAPRFTLGGAIYYYYDHCYHTLINGVYQVVAAPFGLSILALPQGHITLVVNNQHYYYYDGAYYRNYGTHYEVVRPSVGMIVPYLPYYGVSYVYYNGHPAYYYNGYYYYECKFRGNVAYKVVGYYNPY